MDGHAVALAETIQALELRNCLDSTVPEPLTVDDSHDILKGLICIGATMDHDELAAVLGRFPGTCFHKVLGRGARSVRLGSATLRALSRMGEQPRAAVAAQAADRRRQAPALRGPFRIEQYSCLAALRYLCIVPDRVPVEAERITLPCAGDGVLSAILAETFLLVDEDQITGATILRQL